MEADASEGVLDEEGIGWNVCTDCMRRNGDGGIKDKDNNIYMPRL